MTEAPRGFFPGSRVPLPSDEVKDTKRTPDHAPWDFNPVTKIMGGEPTEFFTIGAICAALGRPPVTIRLWVKQGRIPDARFRLPDTNGIRGRRLYTRSQVESLLEVAQQHGILGSTRVDWSQHQAFADDVRHAWSLLG